MNFSEIFKNLTQFFNGSSVDHLVSIYFQIGNCEQDCWCKFKKSLSEVDARLEVEAYDNSEIHQIIISVKLTINKRSRVLSLNLKSWLYTKIIHLQVSITKFPIQ